MIIKYIIQFGYGFSKNRCFFDDLDDATEFARHINKLPKCEGASLHKVECDYENTVKI